MNFCQVPWELLKIEAGGLGFQYLPRVLANVNAWKTMSEPYNAKRMAILSDEVILQDYCRFSLPNS